MRLGDTIGPFLGRLLLSLVFLFAGVSKIFNLEAAVDAFVQLEIGGAYLYTLFGLTFEIVGALLILFGWYTRIGCIILMVFLFPATVIFHAFWDFEGPMRVLQQAMFLKNLAIYGGLVLLASYGPGKWSLDAVRERCCKACA